MNLPRSRPAAGIDAVLLAVLLLLYSPRLTGLSIHEWLGLALGLPVLLHMLLSWRWLASTTRAVVRHATSRTRVNYLLNATLFTLVLTEVFSGVMISAVTVPALGFETINDRSWRAVHNLCLDWTLLFLGLHVAMNWRPLVIAVRRLFRPLRVRA